MNNTFLPVEKQQVEIYQPSTGKDWIMENENLKPSKDESVMWLHHCNKGLEYISGYTQIK